MKRAKPGKKKSARAGLPRATAKPVAKRGNAKRVKVKRVERKRAKSPPRESAIAALLGAMAHEVRTPLTGIAAAAELLATSDLSPQEMTWIESIRASARHLTDLTTLWVEAGRPSARRAAEASVETFSPADMATALAAALTARAQAKGLESDIAIADALPAQLRGPAVRLRAALENLIDNAAKFTERGHIRLSVDARRAGRGHCRLVFRVSDTGVGFSAAEAKHLFRPYAQAHAGIAARFGGAGLGLAFARRVAEEGGGALTFRSRPGKGTVFELTAVLAIAPEPPRAVARENEEAARALRLLAVEDSPMGRMVLKTLIEALGHRVEFAGSGERALEILAARTFDAVLLDMVLPGLGGPVAVERLRQMPLPAGAVPVIGISGGVIAPATAALMQAVLAKPLTPAALAAALAKISG